MALDVVDERKKLDELTERADPPGSAECSCPCGGVIVVTPDKVQGTGAVFRCPSCSWRVAIDFDTEDLASAQFFLGHYDDAVRLYLAALKQGLSDADTADYNVWEALNAKASSVSAANPTSDTCRTCLAAYQAAFPKGKHSNEFFFAGALARADAEAASAAAAAAVAAAAPATPTERRDTAAVDALDDSGYADGGGAEDTTAAGGSDAGGGGADEADEAGAGAGAGADDVTAADTGSRGSAGGPDVDAEQRRTAVAAMEKRLRKLKKKIVQIETLEHKRDVAGEPLNGEELAKIANRDNFAAQIDEVTRALTLLSASS